MDAMEWDPEYLDDEYPEWDPEFLPRLPGLPSPSAALAKRLFPSRGRPTPPRLGTRPTGAQPAPAGQLSAVMERLKAIDERQRATTVQLAALQQRTAVQQSSDTFGPLATGAAGAFALGIKGGDTFSPLVTHGLPVAQLLMATRGRAISSGFRTNPWTTLGFPLAAVLLTVFRDRIPGLAPRQVAQPEVGVTAVTGGFLVTIKKPQDSVIRFTLSETGDPGDPGTGSEVLASQVIELKTGDRLRLRAFVDGVASDSVLVAPGSLRR